MSHFKEREEKVCLNCNAELIGRFCHKCGQENREPRLTVWGMVTHFFNDITHFDGKFFSTTGRLITRPGLLPKQYISGRRASYLDPIRMYIFSSAIFFLIFFSIVNIGDFADSDLNMKKQAGESLDKVLPVLLENSTTKEDSIFLRNQFALAKKELEAEADSVDAKNAAGSKDSTGTKKKARKKNSGWNFSLSETNLASREVYDSVQRVLPPDERDNWLERSINIRTIELNKRMEKDPNQFWKDAITKFVHSFPYLLFVSLPLYALWLKLLYIRRKQFYYVDHGLFLIFLYIFTFIFLLTFLAIDQLGEIKGLGWMDLILLPLFIWGIYYTWRAMHKFYGQGRFKTFVKFLLFNFLCLVSIILLFGLFFILTIFSI